MTSIRSKTIETPVQKEVNGLNEVLESRRERKIAVFPRSCVDGYHGLVPWSKAGPIIRNVERHYTWMPRDQAEKSKDWVQPIPCALIRRDRRYAVLKRVECETRRDLSSRISLLVGGHVDQFAGGEYLLPILSTTLRRELNEELGVEDPPVARVGIVIDSSSLNSSRHVAFVYEVAVSKESLDALAAEEFLLRSRLTGKFFSPAQLKRFHKHFDPWSLIVYEDHLASSASISREPRQIGMPWFV